ncbi:MAG TPA: pitrilysin family protein [Rhizomicrobium sp.]|nr:pitrilysin family protein [Rhizomicrobium sp.]
MNVRRVLFGLAAASLFLAPVFAPSLAQAADVKVLDIGKGQQVWFSEDHTLPMIAITASIPAGSAYDPAGKEGLATFAAALLDEGAGKMDAHAFQTAMSDHAIRLSASPDHDSLVISMVTLSENANEAFRLLGLALSKPRFDESAINRVRQQILASLKQSASEPNSVAGRAFTRLFFRNHPYGHSVSGNLDSVVTINRADLRAFAKTHWVKAGLQVAISGDVDAATAKKLLREAFGKLPNTKPPSIADMKNPGAPGIHRVALPVPQSTIIFGLPGIKHSDPDFLISYVANNILGGGGFSSRLMNEVREKRGLTYGISTGVVPYAHGGVIIGQVATKNASVRETIKVVRETMKKFAEDGPTAKELADAKTYLTGSFPLAFDSNTGITAQLNTFQRGGLSVGYIEKRNALINAVSLSDVRRVAARLFNPAKLTIVVAGPLGAAKPASQPASKPATQPAAPGPGTEPAAKAAAQ